MPDPQAYDYSMFGGSPKAETPKKGALDYSMFGGEKKPEKGSAAGRFASEAFQAGVVEPVSGLWDIGKTIVSEGPMAAAKKVIDGISRPTIQHLQKATAIRRGQQPGGAMGYAEEMAKSVPIIGPLTERIVDELGSGDVAGGFGRAVGTAATFAVPKALGKLKTTAKVESAVPLTRAERGGVGSGAASFLESVTERTTPGTGVFQRFRAVQQEALQGEAEKSALRISKITGSPEDISRLVQKELESSKEQVTARARSLYQMIDESVKTETRRVPKVTEVPSQIVGPRGEPLTVPKRTMEKVEVGGVQPETVEMKRVAIPMLRRLRQEQKLLPPQELSRATALLTRIVESPQTLPFTAFQDARSDLLSIVRSHGDPIPGKAGGLAKKLADATDQAMMTAAEKSGISGLPERVREANGLWRSAKETYNDTFIKRVIESSPEKIPALVRAGDIEDLQLLQSAMRPQVFQAVRARMMRDIVESATTRVPSQARGIGDVASHPLEETGVTLHGKQPSTAAQRLSGQSLRNELKKLGQAKVDALFGANAAKELDGIADLAERVSTKANRTYAGLIAGGVNAAVFSPILRPFGIGVGTVPLSLGTAATFNVLARILTAPGGTATMRTFLQALGDGKTPLAIATAAQISRLAQDPEAGNGESK